MRSVVAYYTRYGNTQRVAEAIAEVLAGKGEARTVPIDELDVDGMEDIDLVVAGSPTHYQSLPKEVRAMLDEWPKRALRGVQVAAFDTSVEAWGPLMWMTAAHRLLSELRKLGGKKIAGPETFLVERGQVPESGERQDALREGELERAKAWAADLLQRVEAGQGTK
jgi:flavodoxin